MAEQKHLLPPHLQPQSKRMSAAQTQPVMAGQSAVSALTVAANAEAAMAAEVAADAMNAVSVVSAQKDGPRVVVTVEVRLAQRSDQTVAAANAVNAHPIHAALSSALSHEMTAKNSATHVRRVNLASHGKVVAKSARAVSAVNARTAAAAPMSSAHR